MLRADRPTRSLALALAGLAGFIDALGFIELGGFFVSFMSGNSTRLGIGLASHPGDAALAAALVAGFIAGVMLGSLTGHAARDRRPPVVVLLVAILLAGAATLHHLARPGLGLWLMVLAMGALNAVFERDGEVRIGVTYMTGTLVKVGQRLAGAMVGGPPWAWTPYLLQWLSLIAGAAIGAFSFARVGTQALWWAVPYAIVCMALALRVRSD